MLTKQSNKARFSLFRQSRQTHVADIRHSAVQIPYFPRRNFPWPYPQVMAIYLTLMLTFYLLYDQDAVSAVVCRQFPDLLISPSHTDGVKPIFTLLTLYHKTHGSFGFKHTILVPFAFATWSLALLALRCLKLLRSFWDNPSPAPSPNEQGINRNIGLRYHGPFATFVVFLQWHLLRFLACGFCDDTYTDLIVAYPLWRLRA